MLSQSEKIKLKQIENKKIAEHIAVDYPETQRLSTNATIKYKKALDTYPDLKSLKNTKLIFSQQRNTTLATANTCLSKTRNQ